MAQATDANGVGIPSGGPSYQLVAITKSDTTDLKPSKLRALWIGGGGDVAVIAFNDTAAVTIASVPSGTLLPIAAAKVMSTNTTATNIVGLI